MTEACVKVQSHIIIKLLWLVKEFWTWKIQQSPRVLQKRVVCNMFAQTTNSTIPSPKSQAQKMSLALETNKEEGGNGGKKTNIERPLLKPYMYPETWANQYYSWLLLQVIRGKTLVGPQACARDKQTLEYQGC